MLTESQAKKIRKDSSVDDKTLSLLFSALGDPARLQVVRILTDRENTCDICVSDIANILGVSVPAASRQLSILETSGIVEKVRKGQSTCFRIPADNKVTNSLLEILGKVDTQ